MINFFSASVSRIFNTKSAIKNCIENALHGEQNLDCDLLVIYSTMGHSFNDLVEEARKISPSAKIIGGTCCGIIGKEGVSQSMQDIAIMAAKGAPNEIVICCQNPVSGKTSYDAGVNMAKDLQRQNPNVNMVHLLASGIDISCDALIRGIESVLGPNVTIFGGTSSDDMKGASSFQFFNDKVYTKSASLIGFADPTLKVITQATHGFVKKGECLEVTKAVDNRIIEFNGQPAWSEYTKMLNIPVSSGVNNTIPIGALAEELSKSEAEEYGNDHILRVITKKMENGEIYYPCDVHAGTKMWLTDRDEKRIFDELDIMVEKLKRKIEGTQLLSVFHADCIARGKWIFGRVLKEEIVSKMQLPLFDGKEIPWLGMYGFGEFARLLGKNTFHNYTTALYLIVR